MPFSQIIPPSPSPSESKSPLYTSVSFFLRQVFKSKAEEASRQKTVSSPGGWWVDAFSAN